VELAPTKRLLKKQGKRDPSELVHCGANIQSRRRTVQHRTLIMKTKLSIVGVVAGLILSAVPVWAHHAFAAEYDQKKPIKLQGKVTSMEWINPHSWIHLDVVGPDGKVVNWMVEGGSPNIMIRRGFTKKSLEVGTELVVEGYLAKNGDNKANGGVITFVDGRKLFVGGSNPDDPGK
jgi:hypothetical protein